MRRCLPPQPQVGECPSRRGRQYESYGFWHEPLSSHLWQDDMLHTMCGTAQGIEKKGYNDYKANIWSCGVILYVLLANMSFQDDNIITMYCWIYRGDFKMLAPNPSAKISIIQIIDSSWFKKS